MIELSFIIILANGMAANGDSVAKHAAHQASIAAYKQSGLEDQAKVIVDRYVDHNAQNVVNNLFYLQQTLINQKVEISWTF